jgi:beta-1,4-mannosyl-glycoprotein beta-1,4-N-acetylglucosaminyltransferase
VDYFVLVESNKTFTGKDKPLVYEMNKHRFAQFNDKIIHIVVEDMPDSFMELEQRLSHANDIDASIIRDCLTTDNIPREEIQWLREFYQKEQIRKGLLKAADNDICYISDVDEIWNPDAVIDYSKDDIFKYRQDPYVYFLNNRSNEDWRGWVGTIATKYQNIKKSNINHIRTWQKNMFTVVRNGGWHFTFQGGVDKVKAKLEAYGHQELNNEEVKSSLDDTIKNNKDIRGRYIKFWTDESNLPTYILKHRDTYKELFK